VRKRLVYNATIVDRIDVTEALAIFRIQLDTPPRTRPWFTAGQYCVLGLNNDAIPALGPVERPMSIASAPEAVGPVEFYVRRVAKPTSSNPLTDLLWKSQPGDRVYVRARAAGVFTIPDTIGANDTRVRILVAAGTGIAPFMSMIRSEVCRDPNADLAQWVLLHGVSYPRDLAYERELLGLCSANHLKYWATISRSDGTEWSGDVGRVESFFDAGRIGDLEARIGLGSGGLTPENAAIFVCGLRGTIVETIGRLIDRGFVPAAQALRRLLDVPAEMKASMYFEDYDPEEALIDVSDHQWIESLGKIPIVPKIPQRVSI
jgi:ferredoxin/flavodoxin---NADP+ reductase